MAEVEKPHSQPALEEMCDENVMPTDQQQNSQKSLMEVSEITDETPVSKKAKLDGGLDLEAGAEDFRDADKQADGQAQLEAEAQYSRQTYTMGIEAEALAPRLREAEFQLRFVRTSKAAHVPVYGSTGAAGADLFSAEDCIVPAKGKFLVSTGLSVAIPSGHYGRVAPRSGLAVRHHIDVGAGVIDEDYRGELKVLLFNFGDTDFQVKSGERIAQLICERYSRAEFQEVDSLDLTERGAGGFGSTGDGIDVSGAVSVAGTVSAAGAQMVMIDDNKEK